MSSPSARSKRDPVTSFARKVASGELGGFGKLAIAACKRHLDDLETAHRRGFVWSPEHACYYIDLFPKLFRHSKGEFAGKPLKLAPWQQFRVGCFFGWLNKKDRTRRFRTAYNDVGRKNGKTTEAAGIGLIGLVADAEAGAEVYSAATKKDQARLVFDEAKRMVRSSPPLRARIKRRSLNLSVGATDSKFEPLSADVNSLDGLNPHVTVVDELHKHKSRDLLDVMDTATGARLQSILWIITTAGDDNPETVYAQERAYAEQVVTGVLKDDTYFVWISCPDKGDAWDDPETWKKGNPNLHVSVNLKDLKRQATKAKGSPAAQREFKRLRLNMRQATAGKAIPFENWVLNTEGPIDEGSLLGRRCYLGLDLSSKLDITALVALFPPLQSGGKWIILAWFWVPGENVRERSDRDKASYERWIEEGWIEATPGDIIDHSAVERQILECNRLYQVRGACYDPWNATQMAVRLSDEHGVPMSEFIQGMRSYAAPTKELFAMVQAKQLEHGGNPVLGWMSNNLYTETDRNQNQMPTKKKSIGRIDGMAALIMARGAALADENEHGTLYSHGGELITT
jgi:phage terminase large subunit-like protein